MAPDSTSIMRPSGRTPYVAIFVFAVLVILGYSYWTLSARNVEQGNEIALLESELRLVNSKKTSAEKRSETISDKVKELEGVINRLKLEIGTHKDIVSKKDKLYEDLRQQKASIDDQLKEVQQELKKIKTETLAAVQKEQDAKIAELKQVQDTLHELEKTPCDESKCQAHIKLSRDKIFGDIYNSIGVDTLIHLSKAGVDIGKYEKLLKKEGTYLA